ncbi:glycerate kinase [Chloroflexota bacterium]
MAVLPDTPARNSGDHPETTKTIFQLILQEIPLYIKNRKELVSHGLIKDRETIIDIIEHALARADPYKATLNLVHLEGDILHIGDLRFDLPERGNIYILGAGKATFRVAKALEEILGERIADGVIIVKEGQPDTLKRVKVREASHPLPDERGFLAAKEMKTLAGMARKGDIVFCAFSGGSSALAPLPLAGITLNDKRMINELLLYSGASIREINAVRKHLSDIKGGNLALSIFPAEIINLTISDVIDDPLDYITDLTVPDTSTFADAIQVLQKYDLMDRISEPAREHLLRADPEKETPKDSGDNLVHTFIVVKSNTAGEAASSIASEMGLASMILTSALEGESAEASRVFTDTAATIRTHQRPLAAPCALIASGETTVTMPGTGGKGGPNQEFALGAALQLGGKGGLVIAAIDTDGTDGPTEIAGGIVDCSTIERAGEKRLDVLESLLSHDSSTILRELGDAVITGHTGTNVNDLIVMLIS